MSERRIVSSAAACLIGNELLSGKVADANLWELARTLRSLGIELRRAVMIADDIPTIAEEVRRLSDTHDVVFTSGGVGPTHDDVTMEGVAAAFQVRASLEPTLERLLREHYGPDITDGQLRMGLAPEGATLALTTDIRWPTVVMRNVWVLPGVPEIFKMKLALLRDYLTGPCAFTSRAVKLLLDEAELKPLLDRVVAAHPGVEIGSYPKWFDRSYRTKITFDGRDAAGVEAALAAFLEGLPPGEPQP